FVDEAALLDEWRLEEWLALFTEDGRYLVPPLDAPEADHRTALFLVADDRRNLASRVRQLLGGSTWAKIPVRAPAGRGPTSASAKMARTELERRQISRYGGSSMTRLTSTSGATRMDWCAARPVSCFASGVSFSI